MPLLWLFGPQWMNVGPNRFSALAVGRTGARAWKYSSSKITCSIKLAPRPPYSLGQEIPTQPAACIVFCQAMRLSSVTRSGATRWSAASSTQLSGGRFQPTAERHVLGAVGEIHGLRFPQNPN
jgi:hypothetical protein